MSVLVECFSVVVQCAALERRYPGGMAGYRSDCANKTLCTDGSLVRVGFMAEADVPEFPIRVLGRAGLASADTDVPGAITVAADCVAVVEQGRGPWIRRPRRGSSTLSSRMACVSAGCRVNPRVNWLHLLAGRRVALRPS